jgi:hypothetical protein
MLYFYFFTYFFLFPMVTDSLERLDTVPAAADMACQFAPPLPVDHAVRGNHTRPWPRAGRPHGWRDRSLREVRYDLTPANPQLPGWRGSRRHVVSASSRMRSTTSAPTTGPGPVVPGRPNPTTCTARSKDGAAWTSSCPAPGRIRRFARAPAVPRSGSPWPSPACQGLSRSPRRTGRALAWPHPQVGDP